MNYRVVIIGSNSKIGTNIIKFLIKKKNINIVAISRGKNINKHIYEYYRVDYNEVTNWQNIIKKNDIIIHLAIDNKDIRQSIKSEDNLFSYCKKIKISKLIYLSTIKVFGENYLNGALNETSYCEPIASYAKKKYLIEKKIIDTFSLNCSINYTILRLPIVYGENISNNLSKLIYLIKIFRLNPFKNIKNQRSFLSMGLLNKVILNLISNSNLKNSILCVADKNVLSTYNFINNEFLKNNLLIINVDLNIYISFFLKILSKKVFSSIYGTLYMDVSKLTNLLKKIK